MGKTGSEQKMGQLPTEPFHLEVFIAVKPSQKGSEMQQYILKKYILRPVSLRENKPLWRRLAHAHPRSREWPQLYSFKREWKLARMEKSHIFLRCAASGVFKEKPS